MFFSKSIIPFFACIAGSSVLADPSFECSTSASNQVEIGNCVTEQLESVDLAMEAALKFSGDTAKSLDDVTERDLSLPALKESQNAWEEFRAKHCDFVGSTFGGGSGTGIAISSCRLELGRARIDELMKYTD